MRTNYQWGKFCWGNFADSCLWSDSTFQMLDPTKVGDPIFSIYQSTLNCLNCSSIFEVKPCFHHVHFLMASTAPTFPTPLGSWLSSHHRSCQESWAIRNELRREKGTNLPAETPSIFPETRSPRWAKPVGFMNFPCSPLRWDWNRKHQQHYRSNYDPIMIQFIGSDHMDKSVTLLSSKNCSFTHNKLESNYE